MNFTITPLHQARKALQLLTLIAALLFVSHRVHATHTVGLEIYYEHIDSMKYEVVVHYYRYCGGSMLTGTATAAGAIGNAITVNYICPSSWNSQAFVLPADTIFEVPIFCATQASSTSCPPNGTWQSGLFGLQAAIYRDTVDFASFGFQCDGLLMVNLCCRNTTVNLLGQPGHIADVTFDPAAENSSPRPLIGSFPLLYADGASYDVSMVCSDPDGDSLVYSLDTAINSYNTTTGYTYVNYNSGYSALQPMPGVSVTPSTGMTSFTATIPSGFNAANYVMAWRVDEYDPTTQQLKGTTIRDIQFFVTDSTINQNAQAPTITSLTGGSLNGSTVSTCVGNTFCLEFVVNDPDTADTLITELFYDSTLMNLNVSATGTNPDTVTICGSALQNLGYGASFIIHVKDTACPFAGHTSATIHLSTPCASFNDTIQNCFTMWDTISTQGDSLSNWTVISGAAMNSSNFNCLNTGCTQVELAPDTTTTYSITSYNSNGSSVTDTLTVYVAPSILLGHAQTVLSIDVEGSTVYLVQYDAANDTVYAIDTTVTDTNGNFMFNINVDSFLVKVAPDFGNYPLLIPTYYNTTGLVQNATFQYPNHCDTLSYTHNVLAGLNLGGAGFVGGYVSLGAGRGVGDPVPGVDVLLMNESEEALDWEQTDNDGFFVFEGLTAGTYRIFVDSWGIDNSKAPSVTMEQGEGIDTLQFLLQPTWLELVKDAPEGITDINDRSIHLFPNPNKGQFTLVSEREDQMNGLRIMDVNGSNVYEQPINGTKATIDVSKLSSGFYIVEVRSGSEASVQLPLIIQ